MVRRNYMLITVRGQRVSRTNQLTLINLPVLFGLQ